jgi:REP element-mobilizing transposase RayT
MYEMKMGGELSVMLDHIYAVVEILSAMSVSQVFHLLKDALSRMLFKQKPNFRKRIYISKRTLL